MGEYVRAFLQNLTAISTLAMPFPFVLISAWRVILMGNAFYALMTPTQPKKPQILLKQS